MNIYLVTNGKSYVVVAEESEDRAITRCDSRFAQHEEDSVWYFKGEKKVFLLGKASGKYSEYYPALLLTNFDLKAIQCLEIMFVDRLMSGEEL